MTPLQSVRGAGTAHHGKKGAVHDLFDADALCHREDRCATGISGRVPIRHDLGAAGRP